MRDRRLILRSLVHYRRTHLGVAAGTAAATAVLVGALMVGDSARHSLEEQALLRLGDVQMAMHTGDRTFTDALGEHLAKHPSPTGEAATTALRLDGVAIVKGGHHRVPDVRRRR